MKKNGEYAGVDEKYIPEDEKYVDESLLGSKEESTQKIKKVAKGIVIGYLVFLSIIIIIIVGSFIFVGSTFFKIGRKADKVSGEFVGTNGLESSISSQFKNVSSQVKDQMNKADIDYFNNTYINLQGEHMGNDYRLDKIITNNKTNNKHIITVVYKDKTATTEDEILSIKRSLDQWTKYYYSLDYDTDGYINKVTIKDI